MKSGLRRVVIVLALAAAGATAFAQPGPRGPRRAEPGGPPMMPQRDGQEREFRRQPDMPHHGRMSPEERRQLRRDIHDAGRELYREDPRHGPRRPRNPEPRRF